MIDRLPALQHQVEMLDGRLCVRAQNIVRVSMPSGRRLACSVWSMKDCASVRNSCKSSAKVQFVQQRCRAGRWLRDGVSNGHPQRIHEGRHLLA